MEVHLTRKLQTHTAEASMCHQHCITNTLSTNMKFKRVQELLFPNFLRISSHPELSSSSKDRLLRQKYDENWWEVTDQNKRFLTLMQGLFITFMFSRVSLAKLLSREQEIFAMMEKDSFSSEVEIKVTMCLGTLTSIPVVLKRARLPEGWKENFSLSILNCWKWFYHFPRARIPCTQKEEDLFMLRWRPATCHTYKIRHGGPLSNE